MKAGWQDNVQDLLAGNGVLSLHVQLYSFLPGSIHSPKQL